MKKKTITRVFFSIVILGFVFTVLVSLIPMDKKSSNKQNIDMLYVENYR